MNYWIFKCNPDLYNLDARLRDQNPEITWLVTRYINDIRPGDVAFLWQTGEERGIRAVMKIETLPQAMPELPSEQSYWATPETQVRCRVRGKLSHKGFALSADQLKALPTLADLSVFHGFQQATNFPVSSEEGAALMAIIGGHIGFVA